MPSPAPSPARAIVLVVDDTADSLRFLTDTIEAAGMTALVATSGENALDLLKRTLPNVILMDAVMPGIDGFETTARIKANAQWAHVPVIFMTGLSEPEHVVRALDVGGVDYVRKPINVDELLARLRVHLKNARVARSSQAALDASGRHLIAVDSAGTILWSTPQAQALLQDIDPAWTKEERRCPGALDSVLVRLLTDGHESNASLKAPIGDRMFELTLIDRSDEAEIYVRVEEQSEVKDVALLRERHSLTQREAEVLLWVSYGKTNRSISDILDISPRTVNKHLEQVFEKLGVETRAAAAAFAVRTTMR